MKNNRIRNITKYVIYLFNGKGIDPTKTRVMKTLYLIDLRYYETYQKTLSGAKYIRYFYGPYSEEIDKALRELEEENEVKVISSYSATHDTLYYCYQLTLKGIENIPEIENSLSKEEKKIIRQIVEYSAELSLDELINIVYATPPMTQNVEFEKRIL